MQYFNVVMKLMNNYKLMYQIHVVTCYKHIFQYYDGIKIYKL